MSQTRPSTSMTGRRVGVTAFVLASLFGVSPLVGSAQAATSSTVASRSVTKVSANTATKAQITAALAAAGVTNAARWAKEVVEYRSYPKGDPSLAKLRQNLVKYNPGQSTLDKIISALKP